MANRADPALKFRQDGDGVVAHDVHVPSSNACSFERNLMRLFQKRTQDVERRFLRAEAPHPHHGAALLDGAWNVNTPGNGHDLP